MKKHTPLFLWLFLLFATSTFANNQDAATYTETDKTGIMVNPNNPEFTIKLKSNPTTGYLWYLTHYSSKLIQPIKHEFKAPTDTKLMGAPGFEIWTFRVKPAGFIVPQQTSIRFVYSRPWEADDKPTQLVFRVSTNSAQSKSH